MRRLRRGHSWRLFVARDIQACVGAATRFISTCAFKRIKLVIVARRREPTSYDLDMAAIERNYHKPIDRDEIIIIISLSCLYAPSSFTSNSQTGLSSNLTLSTEYYIILMIYFDTLESPATDSWRLTCRCRRYFDFFLWISLFVAITKQPFRFCHFDHEKRIKLHHFFSFDYSDETAWIQYMFVILAINFIDSSYFEQIAIGNLTIILLVLI